MATTVYALSLPYMKEIGPYANGVMSIETQRALIFKTAVTAGMIALFCFTQEHPDRNSGLTWSVEKSFRIGNAIVWSTAAFNAFQVALYFAAAR